MIALDADTGEIKWHSQYTPNDPYDYDGVAENVLVEAEIDGEPKKLAMHADRNGFAYAIDRTSGEFVWGTQFVKELTWTRGLDKVTGQPLDYDPDSKVQTYVAGTAPSRSNPVGTACPGNMGGKNWPPTAYHPELQIWYIPVIESCNQMTNKETIPGESYKPREFFTGGGPRQHQPITGSVTAIDAKTGQIVALDATTLEELWRFPTGSGINAPPITYEVDGKQYVALLVGLGGAWPKWFVDSTEGLEKVEPSSMLYVFAL